MPEVAFALRDHDDDGNPLEGFSATVVLPPDGATLRVHELLDEGGGLIVTDDLQKIEALRCVHGLEEVPLPQGKTPGKSKAAKPADGGDGS